MNVIAIGDAFRETLQNNNGNTVATDCAAGSRIERTAVAIWRHDSAWLVVIAFALRQANRDASRKGYVALISQKALARHTCGDQRSGTRRLANDAWPP